MMANVGARKAKEAPCTMGSLRRDGCYARSMLCEVDVMQCRRVLCNVDVLGNIYVNVDVLCNVDMLCNIWVMSVFKQYQLFE